MKTLLLVAGRSKRFWPLQEKPLFRLCGKTILEHQIDRLMRGGMTDIVIVGSRDNLDRIASLSLGIQMIEQEDLSLGMRGALLSALPLVGNGPVCVVSGNDVIDPKGFEDVLNVAQNENVDGALLAQDVDRYFPGGYLSVENNRIREIVEKPGEGNEPSSLVNIVVHVHKDPHALLAALTDVDESKDDQYEQALSTLCTSHIYAPVPYTGNWRPIKYPWHLLELLPVFLKSCKEQSIHTSADIHPTAVIEGPVVIEEHVKVLPHATVQGPCFIGKKSIIATGALVRESSLGEGCVAGYNTEIKGSILAGHDWTHMNYVGDSVMDTNVSLGAGTVTGNFRLDEREVYSTVTREKINTHLQKFGSIIGADCRVGIHVSINPGIKIGPKSFIGPQSLITSDVSNNKYVTMKNGGMCIRDNMASPPIHEDRTVLYEKIGRI